MRLQLLCAFLLGALEIASAQAPDPHKLILEGDRFKPLKYDEMTPAQQKMIDHLLAGDRGRVVGPFNVLLRSPETGDVAQQAGGAVRFHSVLPKDVSETIIIMTGRYWMAQFEWASHKAAALKAGVNPAIVDAIASGKRPAGMSPNMEVAYNFIDELLTTHQVTDATFNAAKEKYGERGVMDMTGLTAWYCLVSMVLDVDRYPVPAGSQPELKPLENPLPVVGMGFATPIPGTPSPATAKSTVNGKTLTLRGDRFKPLTYEEMSPEQKKLADTALAQRGPGGSFNIQLRSPESGMLWYALGDHVRFHMALPEKLEELAIMLTAREWSTQLEWIAHGRSAIKAGLSEDKAKAIGEGKRPEGLSPDEEAVYNFITELYKNRGVTDATFAAVKAQAGERGVVDLMLSSGFYQFVSMTMAIDRLPLGDLKPQLSYLAKPLP